jgi:hypothetical protein
MQRQSEDRSASRTTVRLLESLVRVSESHARIMFHERIEILDAVMAILCISITVSTMSLLGKVIYFILNSLIFISAFLQILGGILSKKNSMKTPTNSTRNTRNGFSSYFIIPERNSGKMSLIRRRKMIIMTMITTIIM